MLLSVSVLCMLLFGSCGIFKKKSGGLNDRKQLQHSVLFVEAFHLKMIGKYKDAVELYTFIADADPHHSASRYEMARIYAEQQNFEQAVLLAKQAIKINPANKWYKMLLIDIYDRMGDYNAVVPLYQELIKEHPKDMMLYYGLANTYVQQKKYTDAVGVLNQLEAIIGISEEISIQKYQYYVMAKKNESAIEEIKKLSEAFPQEANYAIAVGDYYLQTGNFYEALNYYISVFERDSSNYEAVISMAECYMRIGNDAKATELFEILFRDSTVDIDAKMNILMYYYEVSENDTALTNQSYRLLEIYQSVHPDEAKVYSVYGDFLFRDKRFSEAATMWKKVTELDPSKYTIWEHLFVCYDEMKDYQAMTETAKRSIVYFPEQPGTHFYTAYGYYQQKLYRESIEHFENAADVAVFNKNLRVQVLGYLAETYYKLEEYQLSDETFDKLLEIDPKNNWALNNYSFYLALRGEKLDKALEMSAITLKSNPESPSYLDTYGWILYQMGKYEEAEQYISKAVENSTEDRALILQNYGDVLFKNGKTAEAVAQWKLAIQAGGNEEELNEKIENAINE